MSVNGTFVEAKLSTFTLESTDFIFNKCPIYTHDGASAKFSTNSQETDYNSCTVYLTLKDYCNAIPINYTPLSTVMHFTSWQMVTVKETPRKRITVTSSFYEMFTDQLGNRVAVGVGGRYSAPPFYRRLPERYQVNGFSSS